MSYQVAEQSIEDWKYSDFVQFLRLFEESLDDTFHEKEWVKVVSRKYEPLIESQCDDLAKLSFSITLFLTQQKAIQRISSESFSLNRDRLKEMISQWELFLESNPDQKVFAAQSI